MKPFSFDVLILGGGAAGLMAAIEAGRRGRRVAVIERADRPGKKILISGGGRCNFTNLHTQPDNFLSANPHFAKSALARYTPADFIRLVERHGIAYHEKTLGQLFCDGSAQQIVDLLMRECARRRCARASLHGGQRGAPRRFFWIIFRRHRQGRIHSAGAHRRHRRPVDPENGRDGIRLRHRPPVFDSHRAVPPGAGSAYARPARNLRISRVSLAFPRR